MKLLVELFHQATFHQFKDLQRLQRIMDEYVGGIASNYMTNGNMLKRGLELLDWLQEDLEKVGAEDYHQLMRAWELKHRALTSQCVQNILYLEKKLVGQDIIIEEII